MDEEALRALADQCICHPVSRSITEVEEAGSAIIELLDRVKALEGIEQEHRALLATEQNLLDELQTLREERTAWRVTAENAEAAVKQARIDAQAQSCVPAVAVLTPVELLKRAESSLGSFCSDHGWGDADMQTMDDISGLLAAPQPKD